MEGSSSDYALALSLQAEFDQEIQSLALVPDKGVYEVEEEEPSSEPIIGPELEDLDPTPDLHELFIKFDKRFFWGSLSACEVKWSPRMTLCAGVCSYRRREGYCSIRLSLPLLKLRPRKDLVETLLHEMIHAYLFVTDRNDNHDGHGPEFHKHMYRINRETGTNISVYHNFHDEVRLYKQHWWKCDGPCVNRRPFYGMVKRSMNRAPGRNDTWYAEHQRSCGGTFHKVKEPEGYGQKVKGSKKGGTSGKENQGKKSAQPDIRSLFNKNVKSDSKAFSGDNIVGFGGTSYGSSRNEGKSVPKPTSGFVLGNGSPAKKSISNKTIDFQSKSSPSKKQPSERFSGNNIVGFGGTSYGSSRNEGKSLPISTSEFVLGNGSPAKKSTLNKTIDLGSPSKSVQHSPNCDSNAVRQTVRNVWLDKFSKESTSKEPFRKKLKLSSEQFVIPSESNSIKVTEEQENYSSGNSMKEVACPICSELFVERGINAHLDICLEQRGGNF